VAPNFSLVLLERLTKTETNCKGPGYDSTNCLKEIGAFANKKCLKFSVKKLVIIAALLKIMFVDIYLAIKIKFRIDSTCYPEPDLLPIPQHA
jgi:hypothetical protein